MIQKIIIFYFCRLADRQKRADRDSLLQGVAQVNPVATASEPLPPVCNKPTSPLVHGHQTLQIPEPENREGQVTLRRKKKKSITSAATSPPVAEQLTSWDYWGPYYNYAWYKPWQVTPPPPPPSLSAQTATPAPGVQAVPSEETVKERRQREWRRRKAEQEDTERRTRGDPPKRRRADKDSYQYKCSRCDQYKAKQTGHSQVKGKWYCPSSGVSLEEWRLNL